MHSEGQLLVHFCLPAFLQGNMKRNAMFVLFFAALGNICTWQRHSLLRPIASTVRIQITDLAPLALQLMYCSYCIIRNGNSVYTAEYQWRKIFCCPLFTDKVLRLPRACLLVSGVIVQTGECNPLWYILLKCARVLPSTTTKV
jgi:hypothetical protein